MSNATLVPGTAYTDGRDFSPGGQDEVRAAFPIIDSGTLVLLMNRIHEQRHAGRLTREEWYAEQQEAINRTVPGHTSEMFQRTLNEVRERDALRSVERADGIIAALLPI